MTLFAGGLKKTIYMRPLIQTYLILYRSFYGQWSIFNLKNIIIVIIIIISLHEKVLNKVYYYFFF